MKTLALFLAGIAFSAVAAADPVHLSLWITEPIGATNGYQCNLDASPVSVRGLPSVAPTLTEQDVTGWSAGNARWTLNPARFSSADVWDKLQDHCFVLAIDGKRVSSGIVLSAHSARLIGFATLSVYKQGNALNLQLNSGNRGSQSRLIHVEELDAVLGKRTQTGAKY
jgi:hypothetical protein